MSTSDTPILQGDRLPERGMFGGRNRQNFYEQVVLSPQPEYVIVLDRDGGGDEWPKALPAVKFEEWSAQAEGADRYYKVSTSRRVMERQLDVPSKNDDSEFKATVVAIYSVRNAARVVAEYRDRDPVATLGDEVDETVRSIAGQHGVQDAADAAGKIKQQLMAGRDGEVVAVHRCWTLMEPDAGSTERAKAVNAARLESLLNIEQAEHEKALFELRNEYDEKKVTREKQAETARITHEAALDQLRQKLETARAEHRKKLDELEQTRADANADAIAEREKRTASRINEEIAGDPDNIVGYLLSLDDTKTVREAIKLVDERRDAQWEREKERERSRWERLKEIVKLDIFQEDEDLRRFALAGLWGDTVGCDGAHANGRAGDAEAAASDMDPETEADDGGAMSPPLGSGPGSGEEPRS